MRDEFLCRVPAELVEKYEEWTEVVAFRLERISDDEVVLHVTNDMDLLTRPGGS